MDDNLEVENKLRVWVRRLLWTIHYNLIALGILSTYGAYRVIWRGDQITYTSADSLQESESVGEMKTIKKGK